MASYFINIIVKSWTVNTLILYLNNGLWRMTIDIPPKMTGQHTLAMPKYNKNNDYKRQDPDPDVCS